MPFFNLPSSGSGSGGSSGPAILSGSGAPSSTLGSTGAFYLDTAGKLLYGPKTAGGWGTGIQLTGAAWSEISDKPLTFAPSAHSHILADVTGLVAALDGKQASGSYAAASHSHTISNVTGLQAALDGKQASGSYAATVHTHALADVTGLVDSLSGKAATSHTHALADVTGLVTALAGKQASGSYAAATHTHAIADVTGLAAAIAAKQDAGSYATLVGGTVPASMLPAYVDDVLEYTTATFPITGESGKIYTNTTTGKIFRWSGSMFIEISPSPGSTDSVTEGSSNLYFTDARAVAALSSSLAGKAAVSHTHAISDVSGLSDALVLKSDVGHVHTIAAVTGLQSALDGKQASGSYAGAVHSHTASQITDLSTSVVTSINNAVGSVTITKNTVGLSSVDNTADAAKPVSGPQATADAAVQAYSIQRGNHTGTQAATTITGLASVATAGTYSSLSGIPSTFAPSAHTHAIADVTGLSDALGGKQDSGSYATLVGGLIQTTNLPKATASALGAILVGAGLSVSNGVLAVEVAPGAPTSITDNGSGTISWSASTTGTSVSYEVQSTSDSGATYNAYTNTTSTNAVYVVLNGRKFRVRAKNGAGTYGPWGYQSGLTAQIEAKNLTIGSGFTLTDGTITVSAGGYTLPAATVSVLGGVKIGSNVSVSADGTISVAAPVTTLAASAITGLATVATTGKYSDLSGTPSSYSLPTASASVLGGVKIGSNVSIAGDGTISVAAPYTLPAPTATTIGGVKAGTNITIASDGTISAASGGGSYTLPEASASVLGGVKVGSGLSIASGVLSVSGGGSGYTLPVATASVLGGVKAGSNVTIGGDGTLSVAAPTTDASALTTGTLAAARLPVATGSAVGGVIVGTGLSITSSVLSAAVQSVNSKTGSVSLSASDVGAPASSTTGITGAAAISNIVSLTAAQYAALSTKNSSTLYIVAG